MYIIHRILLLISLGAWQLSAPTPIHAQADFSRSLQPPASEPSAPTATGTPAARVLFGQHCVKCHGADGSGSPERDRLPEIPDFTKASWQARRSDAQLMASILEGKGEEMPRWRGRISEGQARGLVAYVRSFAPTTGKSGPGPPQGSASASFSERFLRLQTQMDKLERQYRKESETSPGGASSEPSESGHHEVAQPSAPAAPGTPAFRELFHKHCVKCHGADGTGGPRRDLLPEIPDFTKASWQARRSDAQLMASILEGKGEEMPRWRGRISEGQARGLVAYVRSFAPTTGKSGPGPPKGPASAEPAEAKPPRGRFEKKSGPGPPKGPASAEPAEAKPPRGRFEKMIRWLGKFHPPAVHFPIALLTAAAVAELLRMATGKPAFEAITRFCVWFGTLTAVIAGVLGWFLGSFRLTDASWVLRTHRWLGTSTVACAGLALVLSEVGRRPDRRRTRMCFRVTLLVVAVLVSVTGFFGGAVVFGLDHYAWPK